MPTFGSLFAGIGGMDLGLERAGWECKWQVEIDPFCRKVLAKHWPSVPRHDDVRTFPPDSGDWRVDLIAGGFPCQDVSLAGKGAGLEGERSGLWFEYSRIIRELRPRYVLVENTPGLLVRGFDRVLGELASLGYDAEWASIPAAAVGAPHLRDRVFIVAHADRQREPQPQGGKPQGRRRAIDGGQAVRYPDGEGLEVRGCFGGDARQELQAAQRANQAVGGHWGIDPATSESGVGRVAHGVPRRVERLRALGNAVVPQVAEFIGRRLMEAIH